MGRNSLAVYKCSTCYFVVHILQALSLSPIMFYVFVRTGELAENIVAKYQSVDLRSRTACFNAMLVNS